MESQKSMLTIAEFAARLGVTVPTIRTYVKKGKIVPSSVMGKHMYFTKDAVEKYCGIFNGKKRNGTNKVESYAVIYISKNGEETPKDTINKIMTDNGLVSVNTFDRDAEISDAEKEEFNIFCDNKGFFTVLRTKVKNAQDEEINRVKTEYQNKRDALIAKTYSEVSNLQLIFCNKSIDEVERKKAITQHNAYKENLSKEINRLDTEEKETIQNIKEEYSSELVDEYGNIPEEKKCGNKCTKYAKAYKSVKLTFIRMFRATRYNAVNYYALFTIKSDDLDTLDVPLGNIMNQCYTKVFVVNREVLSTDIKKVLDIINKSGVSEVIDISLFDKAEDLI